MGLKTNRKRTVIWCSKCNIPVIRLGPELDEVFERGEAYEDAVEKPIEEEEHKELVVVKGDTVVDPRTMMIHLEDTSPTHGTMMSSVWLDMCALITIPHCPLRRNYTNVKLGCVCSQGIP